MKILITGVTGLLGNNTARLLQSQGHALRGLTRAGGEIPALEGLDIEIVRGDILEAGDVLRAVRGCRAVVHCAAETRQWPTAPRHYKGNLDGTRNVLAAAARSGVERLIHVSTVNAFVRGTKETPGTDAAEFTGGLRTPGYVQSKILSQRLVLEAARAGRIPAVVVNPSFMLGPFDHKPSSGRLIVSAYKKRLLPVPPGGRNFVHVGDAAAAIANALARGTSGECYILAHENLTYGEFFALLADVSAVQGLKFRLPSPFLKTFGALSGFLAPSKTPLDRANAAWLCAGHYYSAAKAVRDLGMPQTSVRTAVADAIAWFLKKGYLK
jgi:dihydroflavonol-4-reductase